MYHQLIYKKFKLRIRYLKKISIYTLKGVVNDQGMFKIIKWVSPIIERVSPVIKKMSPIINTGHLMVNETPSMIGDNPSKIGDIHSVIGDNLGRDSTEPKKVLNKSSPQHTFQTPFSQPPYVLKCCKLM